jgi:hypothetical protein
VKKINISRPHWDSNSDLNMKKATSLIGPHYP